MKARILIPFWMLVMLLNILAHYHPALKPLAFVLNLTTIIYFEIIEPRASRKNRGDNEQNEQGNDASRQPLPPLKEYQGPFWNKPSEAYLQRRAREESTAQAYILVAFMLINFGALGIMLLKWSTL